MNDSHFLSIIQGAKSEGRTTLTEYESKQILENLSINTTAMRIAQTREQAADAAVRIGFPVVMKIDSKDITHKSDAGGVKVGVKSIDEAMGAFDDIIRNAKAYAPGADITGVTVQPMIESGLEVIVGMKRDEIFGPALMFGLGGIFVELLKDMSLRVYPFDDEDRDAEQMIREIRGSKLLLGYRGQPPKDIEALKQVIQKIGALSEAYEEIKEIDLNPIFVYEKGLCAVDARILLDFSSEKGEAGHEQYTTTGS